MSKDFPHFSPEWLESYNKRLAAIRSATPAQKAKPTKVAAKVSAKVAAKAPPPPSRVRACVTDGAPYISASIESVPVVGWAGKQTKTEQRYNRDILGGSGRFEAVCLYLPGGGRYTPDFMTIDEGVVTFHEVKGSYRLGSQGRAHTAFFEALAAFPMWRFVWATEKKGGGFERKTFDPKTIVGGTADGELR